MPTEQSNMLLPGERLLPGEHLESTDGRFRLIFSERGGCSLLAYSTRAGKRILAAIGYAGPDGYLELGEVGALRNRCVCLVLHDGTGGVVAAPSFGAFLAAGFEHVNFVVQNDGNMVHYVRSTQNDSVRPAWAPGTDNIVRSAGVTNHVPPDRLVVEPGGPGTLNTGRGIVVANNSREPICVFTDQEAVPLDNGEEEEFGAPAGTLILNTVAYSFTEPMIPPGPNDRPSLPRSELIDQIEFGAGDARNVCIEIGRRGRLTLTGLFERSPVESLRNLKMLGRAGRDEFSDL